MKIEGSLVSEGDDSLGQKPPRGALSRIRKLARIARELSEGANFSITRLTKSTRRSRTIGTIARNSTATSNADSNESANCAARPILHRWLHG